MLCNEGSSVAQTVHVYETNAVKDHVTFLRPALDSVLDSLNGNLLYQPPKGVWFPGGPLNG